MATLTITVPDDEMADFAASIHATDADTLAKQKTAAQTWLTGQARGVIWRIKETTPEILPAKPFPPRSPIVQQLNATPEGRNELEKAVQRAQIAALQERVAALSNGQGPDPDVDVVPDEEPAVE